MERVYGERVERVYGKVAAVYHRTFQVPVTTDISSLTNFSNSCPELQVIKKLLKLEYSER